MRNPGTEPLVMISGDVVELNNLIYAEREAHAAEVADLHAKLATAKADLDRKDRTIIALEELRRQTEYVHSERIKEKEILAYDTGKELEAAQVTLAEQERRIAGLVGALTKLQDLENFGSGGKFVHYMDVAAFAEAALTAQPPAPGATDGERLERLSRSSAATFTRVRQSECAGDLIEYFDGKNTYEGKTHADALDAAIRAERGGK